MSCLQQADWSVGILILVNLQIVVDLLQWFGVHGGLCWGTGAAAEQGSGLDESVGIWALLVLLLLKLFF